MFTEFKLHIFFNFNLRQKLYFLKNLTKYFLSTFWISPKIIVNKNDIKGVFRAWRILAKFLRDFGESLILSIRQPYPVDWEKTRDVIELTFFELESGRAFQDRARVGSSFKVRASGRVGSGRTKKRELGSGFASFMYCRIRQLQKLQNSFIFLMF